MVNEKKKLDPAEDWEFWTNPFKKVLARIKPKQRPKFGFERTNPPPIASNTYAYDAVSLPSGSLFELSGSEDRPDTKKLLKQKIELEIKVAKLEKQIKVLQSWIPTLTVDTEDVTMQKTVVVTFTGAQLEHLGRDQFLMSLVKQIDARLGPRRPSNRSVLK